MCHILDKETAKPFMASEELDRGTGSCWQVPIEDNKKLFKKQVGGDHYKKHKIQPWDIILEYGLDFFEGNCIKYVLRRKGNRVEDLEKAIHYLEQCIVNEKNKIPS